MAGIGAAETVILVSSQAAERADAVAESARQQGARILHRYGQRVMIAEVPADRTQQLQAAVPDAEVTAAAQELSALATADLDSTGALGIAAFRLRQSPDYIAAKERRPHDGVRWDAGGTLLPPDPPPDVRRLIASQETAGGRRDVVIGATSQQMTGSIAVGIIIVSGPTAELQFSTEETWKILAEVQGGLDWFASAASGANITWYYDIQTVHVDVLPTDGPDKEALWRNPAMVQLGYAGDWAGVYAYIDHIKAEYGTQWTYAAYFTKYPVDWFGYATPGGPRLVMQSPYDGWGPDNIDRVFAHETGHIFQAPDEYGSSNCNCGGSWGVYDQPNGNCEICAPGGGVDCIMNSNSWSFCYWTPYHLGYPMSVVDRLNSRFYPVISSASGIDGYDLRDPLDTAFAFDYNSSGQLDHMVLYRPGKGIVYILQNVGGAFSAVYESSSGIGGFDFKDDRDILMAFDYNHSGKLDHLVAYRPGVGVVYVIQNVGGVFSAVYASSDGIGGFDFKDPRDRAIAFDYNGTGSLDHLVAYRPGTGIVYIIQNVAGAFSPVYASSDGIGGFDLRDDRDKVIAFDYSGTGKLSFLVLYRPGAGIVYILQNVVGAFSAVYGSRGGIGGFDLMDPIDRMIAYDFDNDGRFDYLLIYRAGKGIVYIIQNVGGAFSAVYASSNGIGGFDLLDPIDRIFVFAYSSTAPADYLVPYRAGKGVIWILDHTFGPPS